ncbi:hypothetical protein NG99_06560 [Erwinia typographi]|uniref:Uncharacterized protein n=1 Tax=Erwinia typographi TaxID=371042 RepID=A0A0A4AAG0_9GAMM|nr:hypothetical protein [Erwinia typographi]KGT94808.1 hypothetical protein NG99_06560 [Erwinia typographi]
MNNESNFDKLKDIVETLDEMVSSLIADDYENLDTFLSNHSWCMDRFMSWNFPTESLDFFEYVVERDINQYIRYRELSAALIAISNTIDHFDAQQNMYAAIAAKSLNKEKLH